MSIDAANPEGGCILGAKYADRPTITVDEAAEILGVSRCSAYTAVKKGEIPAIRIGKRLLVPRLAIQRMLATA